MTTGDVFKKYWCSSKQIMCSFATINGFCKLTACINERRMTLTEEEQKICNHYGQRFDDGKVGCSRCPLAIDTRYCLCKANCTEEEWEERKDNDTVD